MRAVQQPVVAGRECDGDVASAAGAHHHVVVGRRQRVVLRLGVEQPPGDDTSVKSIVSVPVVRHGFQHIVVAAIPQDNIHFLFSLA
mgnify:CR=1 FL=1